MALGNNYDNNKKSNTSKDYDFSLDSAYKFYNGESTVDKTGMKLSFWNNMLKITIAPKSETTGSNNGGNFPTYEWDKGTSGFLSVTKAYLLYHELETLLRDPSKLTNVGIPLGADGSKILYVCNGKEFGSSFHCLVILGVNESGDVQSTSVYEFKPSYTIRDYNASEKTFEKTTHDIVEVELLINALREYCNGMVGAHAYSAIAGNMKNNVRTKYSLEAIANKIGADLGYGNSNYGSRNRGNASSFFNNSDGGGKESKAEPKFTNASLEELDNLI